MTDGERALLDKIDHWDALWQRNVKLPISKAEAELIRSRFPKSGVRDISAPWLPTD